MKATMNKKFREQFLHSWTRRPLGEKGHLSPKKNAKKDRTEGAQLVATHQHCYVSLFYPDKIFISLWKTHAFDAVFVLLTVTTKPFLFPCRESLVTESLYPFSHLLCSPPLWPSKYRNEVTVLYFFHQLLWYESSTKTWAGSKNNMWIRTSMFLRPDPKYLFIQKLKFSRAMGEILRRGDLQQAWT